MRLRLRWLPPVWPFNNNSRQQVLGDSSHIISLAMTYAVIRLGTFVVDRWCQMHPENAPCAVGSEGVRAAV
jgi:hypothetical protein